jgi:hypothetical protein
MKAGSRVEDRERNQMQGGDRHEVRSDARLARDK